MNREKNKIQPIQPKKKPIPIAVLPKPTVTVKSNFNPNIKTSSLKNDIALNINTSKRWVLPPRPRPGRKPENGATAPISLNSIGIGQTSSTISNNGSDDLNSVLVGTTSSTNSVNSVSSSASVKDATATPKTDNPEVVNLKMDYLSKLKEQELILNYIDIINNQIKQLDFIKNGYMTFDTLNQIGSDSNDTKSDHPLKGDDVNSSINSRITSMNLNGISSENKSVTELENINNFQDLNKFLDYLIKSSNLIHRVTKNYQTDNINEQIDKYLKLRKKLKKANGILGQNQSQSNQVVQAKVQPKKSDSKLNKLSNNLLNEHNVFDKLIINDDEGKCAICKRSSPCFCLDIDKK